MDEVKKNSLFSYFEMFLAGLFVGFCIGTVILLAADHNPHIFWLATLGVSSSMLLWKFIQKYDLHIVFSFAMSAGISLVCSTQFLESPKSFDVFTAFTMVFIVFFIQCMFLSLVRRTVKEIINRNKK